MMGFDSFVLFLALGLAPGQAATQRHRNLGKAYYEQGEYAQAVTELEAVLGAEGAGARDYFNAGMAYLQNGEHEKALAAFTTAEQMDLDLIEVDFGLAVLYKRQLRYPPALDAFRKVLARDPDDPCTWLNLGAVSYALRQTEQAEDAFEKVLQMGYRRAQNFYVSALFRTANLLARRGEKVRARELFDEFEKLRGLTPNVSLTPTALENGRYGRIDVPLLPVAPATAPEPAVSFREVSSLRVVPAECRVAESSIVAGAESVFIASPCGDNKLLGRQDDETLTDVSAQMGLAGSREGLGALFFDDENRGFPSLFVWGVTRNHLYRNHDGRFEDVIAVSGLPAERTLGSALTLDYDNDGQLDVFLAGRPSGLALYRNNGDGTFRDVSQEVGLSVHARTRPRGLAAADFDEDGFVDVLVIGSDGGGFLLANASGRFFRSRGLPLLEGRLPARVFVRDVNNDGFLDAVARDEESVVFLVNREGRLERTPAVSSLDERRFFFPIDAGGDGRIDFLIRDREGVKLLRYREGEGASTTPILFPGDGLGPAASVDIEGGAPAMAGLDSAGILHLFRSEPAHPGWLRIELRGKRTNRQAVGATVELKAGRFYQKRLYEGRPVTFYTGGRKTLDVVRVTWANGVVQNEVEVGTEQSLAIEESERQTSSCPFLYVWDGTRFRFLTDVVGRAPLGEILPGDGTVTPNPNDYVRIPPGSLAPQGSDIVLQITEELREQAYLDGLELLAVDHPAGITIYTNEKFEAPPFTPHRLFAVREKASPLEARNERDVDVLGLVARRDGRTVSDFPLQSIPGFAEEHWLTLRPPADLEEKDELWLFLTGWVYWPSSSSMKAIEGHGTTAPRPPSVEVRDAAGGWVTVVEDLGLPGGMGRTLAVKLTGRFLSEDHRVRIRTNFAVYWDEAFFAAPANVPLKTHTLLVQDADLHYRGFSEVTHEGVQRPERYDYGRLMDVPPWNAAEGLYTAYGDVTRAVAHADSELVVMAPGDELTLRFDAAALPPIPEGFERSYVLHVTGFAKDQDPNTKFSRTVGPLPGRTTTAPRTRKVPLLVPPLAPPSPRRQ